MRGCSCAAWERRSGHSLRQAEELFHRHVVAARCDPTGRTGGGLGWVPGAVSGLEIVILDSSGRCSCSRSAHPGGVVVCADREQRFQSRADQVAQCPTSERVIDGAEVALAFGGVVLGDVVWQMRVRPGRFEPVILPPVLVDHDTAVVVNAGAAASCRSRCASLRAGSTSCSPMRKASLFGPTSSGTRHGPRPRATDTRSRGLRGKNRAERSADTPPRVPHAHEVAQPAVIRHTSKVQHPAQLHDRNPDRGEFAHERRAYSQQTRLMPIRGRATKHFDFLLEETACVFGDRGSRFVSPGGSPASILA